MLVEKSKIKTLNKYFIYFPSTRPMNLWMSSCMSRTVWRAHSFLAARLCPAKRALQALVAPAAPAKGSPCPMPACPPHTRTHIRRACRSSAPSISNVETSPASAQGERGVGSLHYLYDTLEGTVAACSEQIGLLHVCAGYY